MFVKYTRFLESSSFIIPKNVLPNFQGKQVAINVNGRHVEILISRSLVGRQQSQMSTLKDVDDWRNSTSLKVTLTVFQKASAMSYVIVWASKLPKMAASANQVKACGTILFCVVMFFYYYYRAVLLLVLLLFVYTRDWQINLVENE